MKPTIIEEFVNKFPIVKTLKFELKPVGETEKNIKEKILLIKDEVLRTLPKP